MSWPCSHAADMVVPKSREPYGGIRGNPVAAHGVVQPEVRGARPHLGRPVAPGDTRTFCSLAEVGIATPCDGASIVIGWQMPVRTAGKREAFAIGLSFGLSIGGHGVLAHPAQTARLVTVGVTTAFEGLAALVGIGVAEFFALTIVVDRRLGFTGHLLAPRTVGAISAAVVIDLPRHHITRAAAREAP